MPTQLKGHRRRESAAQGRGASRQSQVQHISCASVARRPSNPKHLAALGTASLLVRRAAEGPRSTGTNDIKRHNEPTNIQPPSGQGDLRSQDPEKLLQNHAKAWPRHDFLGTQPATPPQPQTGLPRPTSQDLGKLLKATPMAQPTHDFLGNPASQPHRRSHRPAGPRPASGHGPTAPRPEGCA
jgi:hypothetical protein